MKLKIIIIKVITVKIKKTFTLTLIQLTNYNIFKNVCKSYSKLIMLIIFLIKKIKFYLNRKQM